MMSILGVMLGVMILIIVQSVMNGFAQSITDKIQASSGDMRVFSQKPFNKWEALMEKLMSYDFVEGAAPYAEGMVMLEYDSLPAFSFIRGIDPNLERQVMDTKKIIIGGSIEALDDQGVILGSSLAKKLGVSVGETVDLYTPLMLSRIKKDEILLPRELDVVGLLESGWHDIDDNLVLCSLRVMQELYSMEGSIHGIALDIDPKMNALFSNFTI